MTSQCYLQKPVCGNTTTSVWCGQSHLFSKQLCGFEFEVWLGFGFFFFNFSGEEVDVQ